MISSQSTCSRRQLLRRLARGGVAGGLATVAVSLLGREDVPMDHSCDQSGLCRPCSRNARCPRPEAISFRREAPHE